MHAEVVWADEEQQLIHQRLFPGWGRDEAHYIIQTSRQFADSVPHTVHVLVDLTQAKLDTPAKLAALAAPIENNVPDNQLHVLIIGVVINFIFYTHLCTNMV